LDLKLQQAFKEYLVSKGATTEPTDFLLKHLHNKEQGQYVNWLRILEAAFAKDS
jgi:complement component 1 Q subcomponent-binding protein, mitochondrial